MKNFSRSFSCEIDFLGQQIIEICFPLPRQCYSTLLLQLIFYYALLMDCNVFTDGKMSEYFLLYGKDKVNRWTVEDTQDEYIKF